MIQIVQLPRIGITVFALILIVLFVTILVLRPFKPAAWQPLLLFAISTGIGFLGIASAMLLVVQTLEKSGWVFERLTENIYHAGVELVWVMLLSVTMLLVSSFALWWPRPRA